VRNTVRKFVGVALIGVLGAFALQASAGAQTEAPAPVTCVILSVTPTTVPAGGGTVTATGTVGAAVHLTLFAQTPPGTGATVAIAEQDVAAGAFSISGNVTGASDISLGTATLGDNAYIGGCATPEGQTVVRVNVAGANVVRPGTQPAAAAAALAFTGSSDTPSYVLIGIAAIVVGAVLVVAARRRSHLS
jgi:LPXTG-motif cell wall-anchored protein